jgi:hypothetical protein
MSGPSARERGPSGLMAVGPIFNELLGYGPEPPRAAQTLDYPVRPSAYNDRRSAYDHRRSGHMAGQSAHAAGRSAFSTGRSAFSTGRSGIGMFEEDCYLHPQPSQQNFPSQYTMHQPINTVSQTCGGEYFPAPPKRPERNGQSYEPYRVNSNAPRNPNQWGKTTCQYPNNLTNIGPKSRRSPTGRY